MDNKKKTEAVLVENNAQKGSGKKSDKKKKDKQDKEQLDLETIKLVQDKIQELNKQTLPVDDPELKQIRKTYKVLLRTMNDLVLQDEIAIDVKLPVLIDLGLKLSEVCQRSDEESCLLRKMVNVEKKQEKESNYYKEYNFLTENKLKTEAMCRNYQEKIKQIVDIVKTIPEEESKKREELKENFHSNFTDVKLKIEQQEEEAKVFGEENEIMKEQLKEMIQGYEDREKEFWDQVKTKENDQKSESQKYLDKFEQMQINAQKAIQKKLSLETNSKLLTQKKLKLQVVKKQFNDFLETMDKSYTTLIKLKEEIIKIALQVKTSEEKYTLIAKRAAQADESILSIIQKNDEVKKQIQVAKNNKEKLKQQILAVQKQIKERNPQQQLSTET